LYILGGSGGVNNTRQQSFYTYNFSSSEWTALSTTRLFSGLCYSQNLAGGGTSDIWLYARSDGKQNELAVYNLSQTVTVLSWSSDVPTDGGCTVTTDSNFYVFGGTNGTDCSHSLYRFFNGSWSVVKVNGSKFPKGRTSSGLLSVNNSLYLWGGKCSEQESEGAVWKFDLNTSEWTEVLPADSDGPLPRYSHSFKYDFSSLSPRAILFGGRSTTNDTFNDAWLFEFNSSSWKPLVKTPGTDDWPRPRSDFGSAFYGGRLALFGGWGDTEKDLNNEIWELVLNDDCFYRSSCEKCVTTVPG